MIFKISNFASEKFNHLFILNFYFNRGPILAMDMSPTGDMCYTGGYDGSICCWQVPVSQHEVYTNYGKLLRIGMDL